MKFSPGGICCLCRRDAAVRMAAWRERQLQRLTTWNADEANALRVLGYLAVVLYAPSLAVQAVMGVRVFITIAVNISCTDYLIIQVCYPQ